MWVHSFDVDVCKSVTVWKIDAQQYLLCVLYRFKCVLIYSVHYYH